MGSVFRRQRTIGRSILKSFESKISQVMFVSATPGAYEEEHELLRAEQVIRPTGLLDPEVEVRPTMGQMDESLG